MKISPYNSYSDYIKRKYGDRVQKITVDAGFSCPNRDGTISYNGCTYCNNDSFAPTHLRQMTITDQINHGITTSQRRYKVDKFFIYFQPFSNTHAPLEHLKKVYNEALSHPKVIGLCIGTRPDCISQEIVEYLRSLTDQYDITIEYGMESVSDYTLTKVNRGHDFKAFLNALKITANKNIGICAHVILGLPWETTNDWIKTAQIISGLPIDFLKIHQLHLIKNTPLANEYLRVPFPLITLEQYLEVLIDFIEHLNPNIVIQRVFGEAPERLMVSPSWNIRTPEFSILLLKEMHRRNSFQGKFYSINLESRLQKEIDRLEISETELQ